MPTPPRLPRTPSSSALWSLREQRGAPPLLRSAQVQFAEGRGGGGGSHCSLRPCALHQPVRTPVYSPGAGDSPLPPTHASPGGQESPSHPAAVQTSLTPSAGQGRWAWVYQPGCRGGRVYKWVPEKGGDYGPLRARKGIPGP